MTELKDYFLVACGAFFGAPLRYLVYQSTNALSIQSNVATLMVNVIGSSLLAVLLAWTHNKNPMYANMILLLGTGSLGAFTTFSAFSKDLFELGSKSWLQALAWAMLQVLLCVFSYSICYRWLLR